MGEHIYTTEFYKQDGTLSEKEDKNIVAKRVLNITLDKPRFYIKFFRGTLANPNDASFLRQYKILQYKEVNQNTFDNYIKYLTKGLETYLRTAERSIANG